MNIKYNIFAFTSWLVRNTHVETETGLTERDGYEWYEYMWNTWLQNTDKGKKIMATDNMKIYSHTLLNTLLDENEYNNLPNDEKQQYEFYGATIKEEYYKHKAGNGRDNKMNTGNNNPGTIPNPKAELETVVFTFTQKANCVDGPSHDIETLVVEAKSSLGIDGDGGAFYVLKTEQWAVDEADEISEIIKRCEKAIEAAVNKQ
jgi:hypothetical protein